MQRNKRAAGEGAFSMAEIMVALTVFSLVMAAIYGSSTGLINSMTASENYSVTQLGAMDYLCLDLRRAGSYSFTKQGGTLTLPLDLGLPTYYTADGRTPNPPTRTTVTTTNKKDRKKHKVFSARYYWHYGTLGATVACRYYLQNGNLYRKEGSLPARIVGTGIAGVTFGPNEDAIAADPMVTTTMTFLPTRRATYAPPPLSSITFMRNYYYQDYKP